MRPEILRAAGLAAALLAATARADEVPVELELVLLADASSSIRGPEFDLQVHGYAGAFRDPAVIQAILALGGNGIAVTFVQWSASFQQFETVPWRRIDSRAESEAFAAAVESQARRVVAFATATGSAMEYGATLFAVNGYSAPRQVIDISSDERSNQGPHPRGVRAGILAGGITINGLAIEDASFDLAGYFEENVTGGPGSFVMAVDSYADFARAIARKLVREISGEPLAEWRGISYAAGTPARPSPSR